MRDLFFVLLVLACPLMMVLMMRGHGHSRRHADHRQHQETSSAELRRRRDELDRVIAEREQFGSYTTLSDHGSLSDHASQQSGGGR